MLGRPLDVVADEQIEQAVAIEVEPQRRGAERLRVRPRPLARVTSTNVPLPVLRNSRFCPTQVIEQIGKAVVVEVADRDAHAVHLDVEAGAARHVGERAVAVVAVQAERRSSCVAWPGQSMPLTSRMSCQPSAS